MRSVMIGLVAVAVLLGGCSDEENTTKAAEESNTGPTLLDLRGPETTDEVLAEKLKGLTKLEWIYLSNTQITDAGLVHLKGLTKLKELWLEDTQITDAGLVHLKGLTKLEGLLLSKTKITDAGLVHLKGLTKLEYLILGHTQITDAGIQELKKALPGCKIYGK